MQWIDLHYNSAAGSSICVLRKDMSHCAVHGSANAEECYKSMCVSLINAPCAISSPYWVQPMQPSCRGHFHFPGATYGMKIVTLLAEIWPLKHEKWPRESRVNQGVPL